MRNISPLKGPQMDVWDSQPAVLPGLWLGHRGIRHGSWLGHRGIGQQSVVTTSSRTLNSPSCRCPSRSKCLQPTYTYACLSTDCHDAVFLSDFLKSSPFLWHIKRGTRVCISWRETASSNQQQGGRVSLQCTVGSTALSDGSDRSYTLH